MYCMNSMQLRYWEYKTVGQIGDSGHAMVRDTHRKKDFPGEKNIFIQILFVQKVAPALDYSWHRCCCP